jgi:MFS superfamily sulfate permease-like transporter
VKKLKSIDKGILVGIVLTLAFLILWLVTLPGVNKNLANMAASSKMNESELHTQYLKDVDNFNRALLVGNSSFCESILNRTMAKECKNVMPDNVVVVEKLDEAPKANPEDADNFNRAIMNNDKTYCNGILDEKLKGECLNLQV